jgi:Peptidase C13 family
MSSPAIIYAFVAFVVLAILPAGSARAQDVDRAPTEPRGYVVALGLSDELNVFHSEATRAAAILAQRYGRGVAPLVLTNTRTSRAASVETLRDALRTAASRMDREKDVLFVFLTSHGSQQGVAIQTGRRRGLLTPWQLWEMLRDINVRQKVVIISACYSGVFTPLADAETAVITAADAEHPSFGCEPSATWTYFGRAFFSQAMPRTSNLRDTFALARSLVSARERAQGYEPSNPQMRGGESFLSRLQAAPRRAAN